MVLDRRGGFNRGFDRYDDAFPKAQDTDLLSTLQKPGSESLRSAIAWLEGRGADDRVFMWLHLFEPHDPYEPPEPFATRYRDRPYDGEVAYADTLVGELDDALDRLGLKPDTLVVIASDHGEGLGEHDETLHGFFVYQTTLAVPLIFRGPGVHGGGRITGPVGLVDILPTALDLLGLEIPQVRHIVRQQPGRRTARRDGLGRDGPLRGVPRPAPALRMERPPSPPPRSVEVRARPEA